MHGVLCQIVSRPRVVVEVVVQWWLLYHQCKQVVDVQSLQIPSVLLMGSSVMLIMCWSSQIHLLQAVEQLIFVACRSSSSSSLGWVLFACATGFALDPTIGGNFSCNNGMWTPQPRCISKLIQYHLLVVFLSCSDLLGTGRCPLSALTQLTSSGSVVPTGAMQLLQTQDNQTHVLGGSFIVLACASGLTNIGGNLNLTCNADNSWSTPPNCVSATGGGGGSVMTTMSPSVPSGRCAVNSGTLNIANGFVSNANNLLIFPDTSSASGMSIVFFRLVFSSEWIER